MIYPNGVDDTDALQAEFSSAVTDGRSVKLGNGMFHVQRSASPAVTLDLTPITAEAVNDLRRPNISGDGIGTTCIYSLDPVQAGIWVKGGTGIKAHHYVTLSDFSMKGGKGLYAFDSAYLRLRDLAFQGCNYGLHLESVLSSSFRDLDIRSCNVGALVGRGNGFSGFNANTFDKCIFAMNNSLAYQGVAISTNVTFNSCNFEGNGAQGVSWSGAVVITMDGSEGATGANFNNCYFEGNSGFFDVQLVNTGPYYMTHTFVGCNFNRVSASNFVNYNVQSIGRNRVVFVGCSFQSYGNYPIWSGRPYFQGDSLTIVECYNCSFGSPTEKGVLVNK